MTGYTPIYNLPYPQASDLVSAYPGTGQDLAEEVETVLAAKAPLASPTFTGTVKGLGLDHVVTTALTGSSVAINGCFTSTYDDYLIVFRGDTSDDISLTMRLRASGTSATSNYLSRFYRNDGSTGGQGTSTTFVYLGVGGLSGCAGQFIITSPAVAAETYGSGHNMGTTSSNVYFTGHTAFAHLTAQAYDGMEIYVASGTMQNGRVSVYGYKKG